MVCLKKISDNIANVPRGIHYNLKAMTILLSIGTQFMHRNFEFICFMTLGGSAKTQLGEASVMKQLEALVVLGLLPWPAWTV